MLANGCKVLSAAAAFVDLIKVFTGSFRLLTVLAKSPDR